MKKIIIFTLFSLALMVFVGCQKKKKEEEVQPQPSASQKADDNAARAELDRVQEDIETVYNSEDYAGNGRSAAVVLPCGNVTLNTNNFTINYNGVNCGRRVLGGSINVTLMNDAGITKFSDEGARLKVDFENYTVYYEASGHTLVYNGTTYTTNSTGGTLASLFAGPGTVIHRVRGTLSITYDTLGSSTVVREWNLFRKKTFTSDGTSTGISLTFEGDTLVDTDTYIPGRYENVSEYGTNVSGLLFVHAIETPFQWTNCGTGYEGPYVLKQGRVAHTADASSIWGANWLYEFSATAGYRSSGGTPVLDQTCASDGYLLEGRARNHSSSETLFSFSKYQQY